MIDREVLLFIKNGSIALLTAYEAGDKYFIHSAEDRQKPKVNYFPSRESQVKSFTNTVEKVQERGWTLAWRGKEKLRG